MTYHGTAASGFILHSTQDQRLFGFAEIAGDASGLLQTNTVTAIQGFGVTPNAPNGGDAYVYDAVLGEFVPSGVQTAVQTHALLDSTVHTDTATQAPTRGSIIVGNATPAWDELVLGTTEFVLFSDGTDAIYTRLGAVTPFSLGTSAAPSVTFTGDLDTGVSAGVANELVGSAAGSGLMTLDGGNLRTQWVGGQVYHTSIGGTRTLTGADNIVLVNAAGATITLPAAPLVGQLYQIKDSGGNAGGGGNEITIDGNGNNIDGNTSIEINNDFGSFTLVYNGTQWNVL
jgi:hypothetical protein